MPFIPTHGGKNRHILARYLRIAKRLQWARGRADQPPSPEDWDIWYPALLEEIHQLHNEMTALHDQMKRIDKSITDKIINAIKDLFGKASEGIKAKVKYVWSQWIKDDDFDLRDMIDKK